MCKINWGIIADSARKVSESNFMDDIENAFKKNDAMLPNLLIIRVINLNILKLFATLQEQFVDFPLLYRWR